MKAAVKFNDFKLPLENSGTMLIRPAEGKGHRVSL